MSDPFKILGLSQETATKTSIRKAYAIKLKATRPDDDPQGFMELREAFESAKNIIHWQEQDAANVDLVSNDASTQENDTQEVDYDDVDYTFDEKLNFHFNSSPSGKLIEKTMRWILEKKGDNAQSFFEILSREPAFGVGQEGVVFSRFLAGRILLEASPPQDEEDEDEYDPDYFLEEPDFKRPQWLSDEAILSINTHLDYLKEYPQDEWHARQINCVKELFEPVLIEHGLLDERSNRFDIVEFRAKNMEQYNKDDFGSFYNKETLKWVDKSPVGVAMADIKELIESPWASASFDGWKAIIERDELQAIDEFQQLDNELRQFIVSNTAIGEKDSPQMPVWLSEEIILYLDDTFGWSRHSGINTWEYDNYRWLHQLIGRFRNPVNTSMMFENGGVDFRRSFEFLGYQPLPPILNPITIIGAYFVFRALLTLSRVL